MHSIVCAMYIYHCSQFNGNAAIVVTRGTPITMAQSLCICCLSQFVCFANILPPTLQNNLSRAGIATLCKYGDTYFEFINYAESNLYYEQDSSTLSAFNFRIGFFFVLRPDIEARINYSLIQWGLVCSRSVFDRSSNYLATVLTSHGTNASYLCSKLHISSYLHLKITLIIITSYSKKVP